MQRSLLLLLILLTLLAGCETTPPLPPVTAIDSPAYRERQQRLGQVVTWSLQGQVAISHSDGSLNGQLRWQQQRQALDVALRDPFGRTKLKVISDGQHASLTVDDDHYESDDAEALLKDVADLNLPLSALPGWLRGAAGDECLLTAEASPAGEPAMLICDIDGSRWQVTYLSYRQVGNEFLPRKLEINGPDLLLKLAVGRWNHPL
ncbi:MAG: outer membrane lipoprotein LolB [Corallincola sp.]|nr:outer membrane lipoprotein LolB [Corallincola sp.]